MEIVNKIQIRLDSIKTSAATISIPFGLDFFPVDNTELQQTEFVDVEKEKSINPIFDDEKYPFYPTYEANGQTEIAYEVEYLINGVNLDFLGLSDDDILYRRNPFIKTYLRLSFFDSRDTKVQRLISRETIPLHYNKNWFNPDETLKPQSTIPLTFISNLNEIIYNSVNGEGYHYYWYKQNLPTTLYVNLAIMNAKTGKVINLYSTTNPLNPSIAPKIFIPLNGYNYIKCDFFSDLNKRNQYFYELNSDGISDITNSGSPITPAESIRNKITINLYPY